MLRARLPHLDNNGMTVDERITALSGGVCQEDNGHQVGAE
jgi:hypothetical protein